MAENLKEITFSELKKIVNPIAIQETYNHIKKNNIALKPSTKFEVLINDEYFPPKDFLRELAKLKGFTIIESGFNGGQANKPFKNLKLPIKNKKMTDDDTLNINILESFWGKYKEYFKLPASEHKEKYKWAVLKQVYDKWDWNANDKASMFKNAFEVNGLNNLWSSSNFYPIPHTLWMFDNFHTDTINEFDNLFNESLPLLGRVDSLIELYDKRLPELQKLVPDKKINYHSHGDLRAIALYLSLQYPDKYFLFKFTMVNGFLKKLGLGKLKGGETKNLETYLNIANQTLDYIKEDAEFITEYRKFTNQDINYNDESLNLLTQDFIYTIATHFENDGNSKNVFLISFGEWLDEKHNTETHVNLLSQTKLFLDDIAKEELIDIELLNQMDYITILNLRQILKKSKPFIEQIDYLLEFLKEIIMSENKFFKKYQDYLIRKRSDSISNETIEYYVNSAIGKLKNWLNGKRLNFELVINENKEELFKVKKILDKTNMGFPGILSFSGFINSYFPSDNNNNIIVMKKPLNQIFYGPPGTGKTYKILSEYMNSDKLKEEKADDSKIYIDKKKVFWHLAPGQNGYLWEQLKSQDYLGYEWCGINFGDLKSLDKSTDHYDIRSRFSKVKKGDYFCIISGQKFYGIAQAKHDYSFDLSQKSTFDFQTIQVDWIKQFEKPELLNSSHTPTFSKLNEGKRWESLIGALENQDIYFSSKKGTTLIKKEKNHSLVSFHQSFSYEDFIEGIKPDLNQNEEGSEAEGITYIVQDGLFKTACDKAANLAGYEDLHECLNDSKENRADRLNNAKPYYLLIDEINRGNISSIFGELITLLENDKRLGGKHELTLELPYSKKSFGVPINLFLIGTMNTADRSVEALDTALRRRFSFIEVVPNTEILKEVHSTNGIISINGNDIDLIKMLDIINGRIELLIDKDHKIGHSYFINVLKFEDLTQVFKDKVIPLLEEYFYGDFGKIGLVLGKSFIEVAKKENKANLADFEHDDKEVFNDKKLYCFKAPDSWEPKSFQSIYDSGVKIDE